MSIFYLGLGKKLLYTVGWSNLNSAVSSGVFSKFERSYVEGKLQETAIFRHDREPNYKQNL